MQLFAARLDEDLRKIEALSKSVGRRVLLKSKTDNLVDDIMLTGSCSVRLALKYPTVPSRQYPKKVQKTTDVVVKLLSRYPLVEPIAEITTPIFHPNVYASGKICLGTKWLPSEGLDLVIKRIIQIITFDDTILNDASVANRHALNWYRGAIKRDPSAFPTEVFEIIEPQSAIPVSWSDVPSEVSATGGATEKPAAPKKMQFRTSS